MMSMKNIFKKFGILLVFVATAACDLEGDLQNPNQVPVAGADVNYLLNSVQITFADFYANASGQAAPLVRQIAMTGGYRYQTAYQPQGVDGLWGTAYQGVLVNAKTLIPLAEEKKLTTHVAVAKILSAYTYLTLVDLFGDIPQAEALLATDGPSGWNPAATTGTQVYAYALTLLGEAKVELAKTGADAGGALARDIYYTGDRAKWTALANSLELKAWINISMIPSRKGEADAKIATYIDATGASLVNLIDTPAEDFTYKYGTATVPAGSRHPLYDQYYGPTAGSAGGYLGTYFMYEMFKASDYTSDGVGGGTVIQDPRWRYYFYRQVGSINPVTNGFDQKALGCTPGVPPPHYIAAGSPMFCVFEPGFYGRDHGDASGTPPDAPVITAAGVYPAGGRPDNTSTALTSYSKSTIRGDGANGAGIQPIYMSFFTDYVKAEVLARNGNVAAARTRLATAITNSIASVKAFADGKTQSVTISPWAPTNPTAAQTTAWNNFVTQYKTAADLAFAAAGAKLDIVGKEYYKALWGNGMEAYNLYRRTSAPRNMQPALQTGPGPFFRSMVYPAVYANLNSSTTQKDVTVTNKVFWDNNPETLN